MQIFRNFAKLLIKSRSALLKIGPRYSSPPSLSGQPGGYNDFGYQKIKKSKKILNGFHDLKHLRKWVWVASKNGCPMLYALFVVSRVRRINSITN